MATNFLKNGGITQNQGLSGALTAAAARAASSAYLPDQSLPYSHELELRSSACVREGLHSRASLSWVRAEFTSCSRQLNRDRWSPRLRTFRRFLMPSAATLAALPPVSQIAFQSSLVPAYQDAGFTSTITSYLPTGWSFYNGLRRS